MAYGETAKLICPRRIIKEKATSNEASHETKVAGTVTVVKSELPEIFISEQEPDTPKREKPTYPATKN